eukprot:11339044-Alexandrium_andersonii.AAC.1
MAVAAGCPWMTTPVAKNMISLLSSWACAAYRVFPRRLVSEPLVRRPSPGWLCWRGPGCGARGTRYRWPPGGLERRRQGPGRDGTRFPLVGCPPQ